MLFGTQPAAAIANGCAHRAERQARRPRGPGQDLACRHGGVRRGHRPGGLGQPRGATHRGDAVRAGPTEELLSTLTLRRADGREIALAEYPITEVLGSGKTVRAEEIVLSNPDGRSVTTLLNATPIPSPDGAVGSVVVTLQDLAPPDELDRLHTRPITYLTPAQGRHRTHPTTAGTQIPNRPRLRCQRYPCTRAQTIPPCQTARPRHNANHQPKCPREKSGLGGRVGDVHTGRG